MSLQIGPSISTYKAIASEEQRAVLPVCVCMFVTVCVCLLLLKQAYSSGNSVCDADILWFNMGILGMWNVTCAL